MIFNSRLPSWIRRSYYYDSIGGFLYGIFYGLCVSFFAIIARRIGATSHQMAFLSTFPFIGALFTFLWAEISSRRRKMPFLVWIKIMARSILLLMAFASEPPVFLLVLLLYWFFEYASMPAYVGIIQDIYPDKDRGKAVGYVRVELALAAILATYFGGMLLDKISYRLIFPLGALVGIIAVGFFGKIRVESDKNIESSKGRVSFSMIREIWKKDRRFSCYSMIFFLWGFSCLLVIPLYPIFLIDNLQVSNTDAGRLASLFSIFWLISYLFWGGYIDKKSPLRACCPIMALTVIVPLIYSLADNLWMIALATIFAGMAAGGSELSRLTYITRIAGKAEIQKYWGIDYSLMGVRGITAPFLGVILMNLIGIRATFSIAASLTFVAFILMSIFRSKLES